jgi:hypothetical protein
MKVVKSREFTAERAWGALDITTMNGVSCRLHWTDAPYKWHVNDGEEVSRSCKAKCECACGERA